MSLKLMNKLYPESEVEIEGFLASHYGLLLNLITFGRYRNFIRQAIKDMEIEPDDKILDLGAGPGYNAKFMLNYVGRDGEILGLDIGEEAIRKFEERFEGNDNVNIKNKRIDKPLPYEESFDKALTSFVLHGLPHPSREKLMKNARNSLKKGGSLFILDYGDFELSELPFYLRVPFDHFECKYAFDYLDRDWETILEKQGFQIAGRHTYFGNFARLLKARKPVDEPGK